MKINRFVMIGFSLMLLLSLTACSKNASTVTPTTVTAQTEKATAPMDTTAPASTEPEWENGIIRASYAEGVFDVLPVGTKLEIVGQFREYYVIQDEPCDLLIEKRFVRMENESPFERWQAYAKKGSEVFSSVYMSGEPLAVLSTNTVLTVLESKDEWAYVEYPEGKGYIRTDKLSKYYISGGSKPDSDGTKRSDNGTGQPKDGTDVDVGSLSNGQIQGGIVLLGAYYGPEYEPSFEPGTGNVIADNVEAYLVLGQRGDKVKVTEYNEDSCTIWVGDDLYVKFPRRLVRVNDDMEYESWNAYAENGAVVYEEYQLRREKTVLSRNTELTVLDEISDNGKSTCYVVEVDGEIGYAKVGSMSPTKYTAPSTAPGGSNEKGGTTGDTWTPPAL